MVYLTLEQIIRLHALVLVKDGGAGGIRNLGQLEAAVSTQYQTVFGKELYTTVCDKAAALVRGIICDHPFIDGNKRTAMLAGLTLLEMNEYNFIARQGELEDFAVHIAVSHLNASVIADWLEQHSQVHL
ncbi:MAG: type II toxin-antitoxin system death-on-curing family toxin [Candidatus Nanoperiomorbus sp.]